MDIADKDVYEYMMNFADNRTLLNMLSVNKQFRDENFFRKVMERRYPLLIEYRKEGETWRHFFIRMVFYLSELWEKYQIPYIPTKGCSPESLLYRKIRITENEIYNDALLCAASGNQLQIAKYLIEEKGATDLFNSFDWASRYGSIEVMEYLYQKSAEHPVGSRQVDLGTAIVNAIAKEQISSIDFLRKKGYIVKQRDIRFAEKDGHGNIANYLKQFI